MTHTPTPWKVKEFTEQDAASGKDGCEIIAMDSEVIVKTCPHWTNVEHNWDETALENAAFIVHAVNSYEAMKEALEACRPWMTKAIEMNVQERTVLPMSIMRANALLNKALTLVQGKD